MIRINLLGLPKAKKAKRASFSMGGGSNTTAIGLVLVLAVLAGNYGYSLYLGRETTRLNNELQRAKTENASLAGTKAKYQEREKQFQLYDRRVKVIHQLQEAQTGPSELLTMVASTVNNTDAVWLTSMTEEGNNINLQGTAVSASAVANLISNLNKAKYFKSVEIKETFQDERVTDVQAFTFTLVCEKQKS